MKYIALFSTIFIFISCNNISKKQDEKTTINSNHVEQVNIKNKIFEETFQPIDPTDYRDWLSNLMMQEDFTVITSGNETHFNSMAASWEAMALYFNSPKVMNILGAQRYTLELIRKHKTYTLSFFPEQYKGDVFAFGSKSGRNSNKMKETRLTYVKTPSGNITYEEAEVVIECQLFEITTVNPDDFYSEDGKGFIEKAYNEAHDYHKLVFGNVTKMWIQKGSEMDNTKQQEAVSKGTGKTLRSVVTKHKKASSSQSFPFVSISLVTLLVYALSFMLQKKKYITKGTHRKIWNVVLLLSFLISGLLGLFLIFIVNYHFTFSLFPLLRILHVDLGIVMVIVSIFHCIWHIDYFKKILSKMPISKSAK